MAGAAHAQDILGFRLLALEGSNVKWSGGDGAPTVVTYAVVDRTLRFPKARNCAAIVPVDDLLATSAIDRAAFAKEVKAAFAMWETVANIEFRETSDPLSAGILIGAQAEPKGYAFANVDYQPGPSYQPGTGATRQIHKSLICLNPDRTWKIGFGGNIAVYDLRYTIAHEIGHAIGLDHPDRPGQLMSFKYDEAFETLQAGDVAGAVRLYGTRPSAKATPSREQGPPLSPGARAVADRQG